MIVYDKDGNVVADPDLAKGKVDRFERPVVHRWIVDAERQSHWEVVAEYPETGGKDVEEVTDVEEQGHWQAFDASAGEPIADFDREIPEDAPHELEIIDIFVYGVYTEYTPEEIAEMERQQAEAEAQAAYTAQMGRAVSFAVMSLDLPDDQIMEVSMLFPLWEVGGSYMTGDVRRHDGALYRALQDSTGAAEHTPDIAVSLWKRIGEPGPSGVFPWVQPLGATDAYAKGDKVTHAEKTWVSDIDANVWEPGVYGWSEVDG